MLTLNHTASRRIGHRIAIVLFIVAILLSAAIAIIESLWRMERFEQSVRTQASSAIDILESVHTQSMLFRQDKGEGGPAVDVLNGTFAQLDEVQEATFWLVMSPKVIDYQLRHGHSEIERPKDALDEKVIESKQAAGEFIGDQFRYSRPAVLGQGNAKHPKCARCHGELMGLQPNETIGAFSIAIDLTEEKNTLFLELGLFSVTLLLSAIGLWFLINFLVRKLAVNRLETLNQLTQSLSDGKLLINIPHDRAGDEISKMFDTLSVFRENALKRQAAEQEIRDLNTHLEQRVLERTQRLEVLTQEAQAASQAKSEFLSSMSHEIRTPMNGVIGMTGLLLDTELNAEQKHFVEVIHQSGDSLLHIINDILDFSKIEAQKLELEESNFDLLQIVESVAEILAPKAHEKGIEIGFFIPNELQGIYLGDAGRLRQVLINLAGNAVKFTKQGSVGIEVEKASGNSNDKSNATLLFKIIDTGIGIPESAMGQIFESFHQVDSSINRKYDGTGLGLTISERIVTAMGGVLSVDSEHNKGSTFSFSAVLPKIADGEWRKNDDLHEAFQSLHFLIVDDLELNREIFVRTLQGWGASAEAASSADAGLEALDQADRRAKRPDVVITDLMMPERDGIDFITRMRADSRFANIPVILASSASLNKIPAERQDELNITAVHMKPVRPSVLYNSILDIFAWKKKRIAPDSSNTTEDTAETEHVALPRLRVLVVEDNHVNQLVAVRVLNRIGCYVNAVADGQEALQAVTHYPYDVVFMDIQMPVLDGLEATRQIRANGNDITIIALTADVSEESVEQCLAAGMNAYLPKPFRQQDIVRLLKHFFV